tara:strand:- start:486 stop:1124 length:639 start_codon:yes stop_codon:yes gene_type:complete
MAFHFDFSSVFFVIYLVSIIALYMNKRKEQILMLNVSACFFAGIYLYMNGGDAGVIACAAAASGSLFQLCAERYFTKFPKMELLLIKAIGCSVFATIGILAVYKSVSDLFLVIAIVSCRSSEMLKRQDLLRLGYLFAEVLWMHYAIDNGFALFAGVHLAMTVFGLFILLRDYGKEGIVETVAEVLEPVENMAMGAVEVVEDAVEEVVNQKAA